MNFAVNRNFPNPSPCELVLNKVKEDKFTRCPICPKPIIPLFQHSNWGEAPKFGLVESTKDRRPLQLIYYQACIDKDDARKREKYLKT